MDKEKTFLALLTDLSKTFHCLPQDHIIAKRNAYGFNFSTAKLIQSYLSNRKQRTKINNTGLWEEIFFGFPQVLSWDQFYLISLVYDLFIIMNKVNFASYTDDNTPYVVGDGVIQIIESLKEASDELRCWFVNNQMKANPGKCLLITSNSDEASIMSKTAT